MFVLNEAENKQNSSKNSKRHLEDESGDEETDQKDLYNRLKNGFTRPKKISSTKWSSRYINLNLSYQIQYK
jgi:hypothetical protein